MPEPAVGTWAYVDDVNNYKWIPGNSNSFVLILFSSAIRLGSKPLYILYFSLMQCKGITTQRRVYFSSSEKPALAHDGVNKRNGMKEWRKKIKYFSVVGAVILLIRKSHTTHLADGIVAG